MILWLQALLLFSFIFTYSLNIMFLDWKLCRHMYLNKDTLCSGGNTHNPNFTRNATLVTILHQNHSLYYQGEPVNITADIDDPMSDHNITYTYLFCYARQTSIGNLSFYLSSTKSNETNVVSNTTWNFIGPLYLYLFTWDNTGRNGCDYANLEIKSTFCLSKCMFIFFLFI